MSDTAQGETGADVNALRNNFEVGESKTLGVKNVKQLPDGKTFTVSATIEEGDNDTDNVTVAEGSPEGWEPVAGENAKFTRTEDGLTVAPVDAE